MENNTSDSNKKVNLEILTKEDLIKKCKGLLTIAQKAKLAKDVLQEENNQLKLQINNTTSVVDGATQELVEQLTLQKLELVTTLEDMKVRNTALDSKLIMYEEELHRIEEKFNKADIENVSYKRQISRLTDENEQLITHLDSLEKQIEELNRIGIQQQQQLLELEENNKLLEENHKTDDKVAELQNMLSISLAEVKKLQQENSAIEEKLENLKINLSSKDNDVLVISEELKSKSVLVNELTKQVHQLRANEEKLAKVSSNDYENLKLQCEELREKLDLLNEEKSDDSKTEEIMQELRVSNEKLREKLKSYHSKIVKFAGLSRSLKEDKNEIVRIFKLYTEQVTEWKQQLHVALQELTDHMKVIMAEKNSVLAENALLKQNAALLKEQQEVHERNLLGNEGLQKENSRLVDELHIALQLQEEHLSSIDSISTERDNLMKKMQKYEEEMHEKANDNIQLHDKLKESKEQCNVLAKNLDEYKEKINNEEVKYKEMTDNYNEELKQLKEELQLRDDTITEENATLKETVETYCRELELLRNENKNLTQKVESEKKLLIDYQENLTKLVEIDDLKVIIDNLKKELEHYQATERQFAAKSSEEILKLVQENKDLSGLNAVLQEKVDKIELVRKNNEESQTDDRGVYPADCKEEIHKLKQENTELLTEMNEMNQALKERGETISKLEAHCEEVMKKLQIYETQANKNVDNITQKEELIKKLSEELELLKTRDVNSNNQETSMKDEEIERLKSEIETIKEKLNCNLDSSYAESETMSTSTISRTEEVNRLRDLEGSWEERYVKLRTLAIKLKGKIRELTTNLAKEQSDKDDVHKKLANALKTIQTLQSQSDKLEDDLQSSKQQCKSYLTKLNVIAEEISKDKKLLSQNEETIGKLKIEIEELKNERQQTENWKKQVGGKVQTLRKELEVKNMLKKDFESKITKLTADLESKEQALKTESESLKQTKSLLDQSNNECKKNSVLNLEMQDYERSVKELSQKLEKKQEQITKLKTQQESQKSTINALREQNKLLEERIQNEESDLNAASSEINTSKKKINNLEEIIQQKEDKVQAVTQLLETTRSENEELSTELSKLIAEHQKNNATLKNERDHLRSQNLGLQQSLREAQDSLKLTTDELKVIQSEYNGYKVRAQSVLRQNQSRDVGMEEKLLEEAATFKAQNDLLNRELNEAKCRIDDLEKDNKQLLLEKEEMLQKCKEFVSEIEDLKNQFVDLSSKHQKTIGEHAETVRNLKIHADTLSQCYRQQITEQEVRHNREIIELQSRLDKPPSPTDPPTPVLPTMPREDGEGSESIESNNATNVYPVPLERLLGTDVDQEVSYIKKQLNEHETKVTYLTALLSDTEQDLAKHVQMNKLLKEEIRRQQRSVEREKHAENLEYLKNVVFKFITLNSGDERSCLVPVLNTILKLSPEETQKLSIVAKGDPGLKGWTNYLPMWSSPTKPQ